MKLQNRSNALHSRFLLHALAAAVLTGLLPSPATAQAPAREGSVEEYEDSLVVLTSRLDQKRAERLRLQRMLGALNEIDSTYKVHYPTWVVLDEDLKERIHRLFRFRNPDLTREGEVTVVSSPAGDELVELTLGDEHVGRVDSRTLLSVSLVDEILAAN